MIQISLKEAKTIIIINFHDFKVAEETVVKYFYFENENMKYSVFFPKQLNNYNFCFGESHWTRFTNMTASSL